MNADDWNACRRLVDDFEELKRMNEADVKRYCGQQRRL